MASVFLYAAHHKESDSKTNQTLRGYVLTDVDVQVRQLRPL